jgi:hypothetical protein
MNQGGTSNNPLSGFHIPSYTGSSTPVYNFTDAPKFKPPDTTFTPPKWEAPDVSKTLANDPGYQFRLMSGMNALQNSAAAKGTLQTGGTLKELLTYGQEFGSQEYTNVWNRSLEEYNQKYRGTRDTYDLAYQKSKDIFTPQFAAWQTMTAAEQARAMASFQREWDIYALGVQASLAQQGFITQLWGSNQNPNQPYPTPPAP